MIQGLRPFCQGSSTVRSNVRNGGIVATSPFLGCPPRHAYWVAEALEQETRMRDNKWSESIAVGSKEFIANTKEELGPLFLNRKAAGEAEQYELHDPQEPYNSRFAPEIDVGSNMNAYEWQ